MMLQLVYWSVAIGFTPLALHLGIRLIMALGNLLHFASSAVDSSMSLAMLRSSGPKSGLPRALLGTDRRGDRDQPASRRQVHCFRGPDGDSQLIF